MHISIDVTDKTGEKLIAAARGWGGDMAPVIEQLAMNLPEPEQLTPENDPLLAMIKERLSSVPTDPQEIQEAETDLLELKRNLNRPRKEAGARLLFPDVEEE